MQQHRHKVWWTQRPIGMWDSQGKSSLLLPSQRPQILFTLREKCQGFIARLFQLIIQESLVQELQFQLICPVKLTQGLAAAQLMYSVRMCTQPGLPLVGSSLLLLICVFIRIASQEPQGNRFQVFLLLPLLASLWLELLLLRPSDANPGTSQPMLGKVQESRLSQTQTLLLVKPSTSLLSLSEK